MKAKTKKTVVDLIVEVNKNGHHWGRIEDKGNFMATGQGETIKEVTANVKASIEDYQQHEGKKDSFWSKIDVKHIEFNIKPDLSQ